MRRRVYLKDGRATTQKTDRLIGYLDERGIITPYQTVEVDQQTTSIIPVSEDFADRIDGKIKEKSSRRLRKDIEMN